MLRKVATTLALFCALFAHTSVAQSSKFEIVYDVLVAGTANINDVDGEYGSGSVTALNKDFALTISPIVLQWGNAKTKHSGNVEATIKMKNTPIYTGVGKMIGKNGTNAYAVAMYRGPERFPVIARLGVSKSYFSLGVGF